MIDGGFSDNSPAILMSNERGEVRAVQQTGHIIRAAEGIVQRFETRNPDRIAGDLGIRIMECPLGNLKGMYKIIERNRVIFLNSNLEEVMRGIVLLHEIGHDQLHRREAEVFQEFNLFDMAANQMEYEANLFAAQIALPDEEILEYVHQGYTDAQIAQIMRSDINLVALKISELARRGHQLRVPEHKRNFLE